MKMDVYWYWPFSRAENSRLAAEVASRAGVKLNVSVIQRTESWTTESVFPAECFVELHEVNKSLRPGFKWLVNRGRIQAQRALVTFRRVRELRPTVVHYWYFDLPVSLITVLGIRSMRSKVVVHVHDVLPHSLSRRNRFHHFMQRVLLHEAAALTVYDEALVGEVSKEYGIPRTKIFALPMVMPLTKIDSPPPAPAGTSFRILLFGTLRRNKGVGIAIEALRKLDSNCDIELLVAGAVADEEVLSTLQECDDPRLRLRIGFHSWNEKAHLFEACDVVLLPYTDFRAQSAVLYDAYSFGKPVIASSGGALGRSVLRDASGWLFDVSSPDSLRSTITSACTDRIALSAYREGAVRAAESHSPAVIADRLLEIYSLVASDSF
jgi:glycosyltransferase involved in cell wall biosynthesis